MRIFRSQEICEATLIIQSQGEIAGKYNMLHSRSQIWATAMRVFSLLQMQFLQANLDAFYD